MAVTSNPDVWAVSVEGLPHDPALARVGNFLASGPKRGIVPAGPSASGAVRATAVPSGRVRVMPFVAVAPNPASGHFGETYVWRSRDTKEVTIRATSSGGGRTDAIISRVWDPGVFGVEPSGDNLMTLEVIEGVDAGVESADVLAASHNLDFPFVWHGNITLPASTGTITNAMITDRRYQIGGEVTHAEHIRVGDIGSRYLNTKDSPDGEIFPSVGGQHDLFIPDHASEMKVTFEWLDVEYLGESNTFGDRFVRIGTGGNAIDTHKYHFDAPQGSLRQTVNWKVVDVIDIPESMRGTTQRFEARAYLGQSANTGQVRTREASSTILEVEFRETLN